MSVGNFENNLNLSSIEESLQIFRNLLESTIVLGVFCLSWSDLPLLLRICILDGLILAKTPSIRKAKVAWKERADESKDPSNQDGCYVSEAICLFPRKHNHKYWKTTFKGVSDNKCDLSEQRQMILMMWRQVWQMWLTALMLGLHHTSCLRGYLGGILEKWMGSLYHVQECIKTKRARKDN